MEGAITRHNNEQEQRIVNYKIIIRRVLIH